MSPCSFELFLSLLVLLACDMRSNGALFCTQRLRARFAEDATTLQHQFSSGYSFNLSHKLFFFFSDIGDQPGLASFALFSGGLTETARAWLMLDLATPCELDADNPSPLRAESSPRARSSSLSKDELTSTAFRFAAMDDETCQRTSHSLLSVTDRLSLTVLGLYGCFGQSSAHMCSYVARGEIHRAAVHGARVR